jgi:hypothetical protein
MVTCTFERDRRTFTGKRKQHENFLLGESLTFTKIIGLALVILGVILVEMP